MSNLYFHLNFRFQKAKYLNIEGKLIFDICFWSSKDDKGLTRKRYENIEGKIVSWRKKWR